MAADHEQRYPLCRELTQKHDHSGRAFKVFSATHALVSSRFPAAVVDVADRCASG